VPGEYATVLASGDGKVVTATGAGGDEDSDILTWDKGQGWTPRATVTGAVASIAAGPSGFVAATAHAPSIGASFAYSSDGITWRTSTPILDAPGDLWLQDVTSFGRGWAAIGSRELRRGWESVVLVSANGLDWQLISDIEAFKRNRHGDRDVTLNAITGTPHGGLMVAGEDSTGHLGVWTSDDGLAWEQSPYRDAPRYFVGRYSANDLVSIPDRTMIVGYYPDFQPRTDDDRSVGGRGWSAGVWTSPAPEGLDLAEPRKPCPAPGSDFTTLLSVEPRRRASCFGDIKLSFRAYVTRPTSWSCGLLEPCEPRPRWLARPNGSATALPLIPPRLDRHPRRVDSYTLGGTLFLPLHVAPGSKVGDLKRGWAQVTGRFDHPDARQCRGLPKAMEPRPVAACRTSFVVTRIRQSPGP
jgi:hypothetical protein